MPCGGLKALYAAGIRRPFEPGFVGECDQLVWFRVCGSSPAYLASIFTSGFCLCAFACISFAIWLHLEAAANRAEGISAGSYTGPPAVLSEPSEASTWDVVPPLPATPERRTTSWAQGSARSNSSAYDDVARSIPDLPEACIDLCNRLSGTPSSVRARALRAWNAGCWAGAVLEGSLRHCLRWLHTSSVKTAMGTSVVQVPPTPSR